MSIKRRVSPQLISDEKRKELEEERKKKPTVKKVRRQVQTTKPTQTEATYKEEISESTKPQLRKKEKFEDRHQRVTTYLLKENYKKANEIKETYGIPVSETVNNALKEYINNYNL